MCWHTSFWTRGWELLSSWVRKLIQKPCKHQNPSAHPTDMLKCSNIWNTVKPKVDFLNRRMNKRNVCGPLPHRGSAEHCCRGCSQRMWGPCTEYAGCSGVCGQSRPPDAPQPVSVPLDKNCKGTFVRETETIPNKQPKVISRVSDERVGVDYEPGYYEDLPQYGRFALLVTNRYDLTSGISYWHKFKLVSSLRFGEAKVLQPRLVSVQTPHKMSYVHLELDGTGYLMMPLMTLLCRVKPFR